MECMEKPAWRRAGGYRALGVNTSHGFPHRVVRIAIPRRHRLMVAAIAQDVASPRPPSQNETQAGGQPDTLQQMQAMQQQMAAMAELMMKQAQQNQELLSTVTTLSQQVSEQAKLLQASGTQPAALAQAAATHPTPVPAMLQQQPANVVQPQAQTDTLSGQASAPATIAAVPSSAAGALPATPASTHQPQPPARVGSALWLAQRSRKLGAMKPPPPPIAASRSNGSSGSKPAGQAAKTATPPMPVQPAPPTPAVASTSAPEQPQAQRAKASASSALPVSPASGASGASLPQSTTTLAPGADQPAAPEGRTSPVPQPPSVKLLAVDPPAAGARPSQGTALPPPTTPARPQGQWLARPGGQPSPNPAAPAAAPALTRPVPVAAPPAARHKTPSQAPAQTRPVPAAATVPPAAPPQQSTPKPKVVASPPAAATSATAAATTTTPAASVPTPAAAAPPQAPAGSAEWLAQLMRSGALRTTTANTTPASRQPTITPTELESLLSKARGSFSAAPARDLVSILSWLASNRMPTMVYAGEVCGALLPQLTALRLGDCVRCLQALAALSPEVVQALTPRVLDPNHLITYGEVVCRLTQRFHDALKADQRAGASASDAGLGQEQGPGDDAGLEGGAVVPAGWHVCMAGEVCEAVAQLSAQQPQLMQAHGAVLRRTVVDVLSAINRKRGVEAVRDTAHLVRLMTGLTALGISPSALPRGLVPLLATTLSHRLHLLTPAQVASYATAAAALTSHATTRRSSGDQPDSTTVVAPPWCGALEARSLDVMAQLSLDEAAAVAHAFVCTGHKPKQQWFQALMSSTATHLPQLQPAQAQPGKATFTVPLGAAAGKAAAGVQRPPVTAAPQQKGGQAAPPPWLPASLGQLSLCVAQLCGQPDAVWVGQLCSAVDEHHARCSGPALLDALWGLCCMGSAPSGPAFNSMFMKTLGHVQHLSDTQLVQAACLPTYIAAQHAASPSTAPPLSSKWWDELQPCLVKLLVPPTPRASDPSPSGAAASSAPLRQDQVLLLAASAAAVASLPAAGTAGRAGKQGSGGSKQGGRKLYPAYVTALSQALSVHTEDWSEQQVLQLVQLMVQLREASGGGSAGASSSLTRLLSRYETVMLQAAAANPPGQAAATSPRPAGKATKKAPATQQDTAAGAVLSRAEQQAPVFGLMQACGHTPRLGWMHSFVSCCFEVPPAQLSPRTLAACMAVCDMMPDTPASPYLIQEWLEQALPCLATDAYRKAATLGQLLSSCAVLINADLQPPAGLLTSVQIRMDGQLQAMTPAKFLLATQVLSNAGVSGLPASLAAQIASRGAALTPQLTATELLLAINARMAVVGPQSIPADELQRLDDAFHQSLLDQPTTQGRVEEAPVQGVPAPRDNVFTLLRTLSAGGHAPEADHMQVFLAALQRQLTSSSSSSSSSEAFTADRLAMLINTLAGLRVNIDVSWLEAYEACWSKVSHQASVADLGAVMTSLVVMQDDSQVWASLMEAICQQLTHALDPATAPQQQPLPASGLALALVALTHLSEHVGYDVGYHALIDRCIALLPASLAAESATPPTESLHPTVVKSLMLSLAARVAAELPQEEAGGRLADSEALPGARSVMVALEGWLTGAARLPSLHPSQALEYLSFSLSLQHDVSPSTLDKLVGAMERQAVVLHRLEGLAKLEACQQVCDSLVVLCEYRKQLTCADTAGMRRWLSLASSAVNALDREAVHLMTLRQLGLLVSRVHLLGIRVDAHTWQYNATSAVLSALVASPQDQEEEDDQGVLLALQAVTEACAPDLRHAVWCQLVLGSLSCRLFGTAPSGFLESYRQTLLDGVRKEAGNAPAGELAAAERQADKMVGRLPEHLTQERQPELQVIPSMLAQYLTVCMQQPHRPDTAWLNSMCRAVLPTLLQPGSQPPQQPGSSQWDVGSLCYLLSALTTLKYKPGRIFQARVAACSEPLLTPEEGLEPAQAVTMLVGVCAEGYNPGQAWLERLCSASLPYLHLLASPAYLDAQELDTPATQADGGAAQAESSRRPAAAGGVMESLLWQFVAIETPPAPEWLLEFCKVLAVVSRELTHERLAAITRHLVTLITLDPQQQQKCSPQLDVLLMELMTRATRAARPGPDASAAAVGNAADASSKAPASSLSPCQVPPTAEEASLLRTAQRALQGILIST